MEQLIESQYAKKIKENINLKSNNEKLKQELKSQKDILNQVKIQLQQSLSVLIRQSKTKNENISNASYDKLIGNIYLKIKKLKLFQGELKSKLNESELLKKKKVFFASKLYTITQSSQKKEILISTFYSLKLALLSHQQPQSKSQQKISLLELTNAAQD